MARLRLARRWAADLLRAAGSGLGLGLGVGAARYLTLIIVGLLALALVGMLGAKVEHQRWEDGHGIRPTPTPEVITITEPSATPITIVVVEPSATPITNTRFIIKPSPTPIVLQPPPCIVTGIKATIINSETVATAVAEAGVLICE